MIGEKEASDGTREHAHLWRLFLARMIGEEASDGTESMPTVQDEIGTRTQRSSPLPRGKAGRSHGEAGRSHGEAGRSHGEAGRSHGEAGRSHGKAGRSHGKARTRHGLCTQAFAGRWPNDARGTGAQLSQGSVVAVAVLLIWCC